MYIPTEVLHVDICLLFCDTLCNIRSNYTSRLKSDAYNMKGNVNNRRRTCVRSCTYTRMLFSACGWVLFVRGLVYAHGNLCMCACVYDLCPCSCKISLLHLLCIRFVVFSIQLLVCRTFYVRQTFCVIFYLLKCIQVFHMVNI